MEELGNRTLVVIYDIAQVVSPVIMGLSHAHRVVREVDIAVVAFAEMSVSKKLWKLELYLQKSA